MALEPPVALKILLPYDLSKIRPIGQFIYSLKFWYTGHFKAAKLFFLAQYGFTSPPTQRHGILAWTKQLFWVRMAVVGTFSVFCFLRNSICSEGVQLVGCVLRVLVACHLLWGRFICPRNVPFVLRVFHWYQERSIGFGGVFWVFQFSWGYGNSGEKKTTKFTPRLDNVKDLISGNYRQRS